MDPVETFLEEQSRAGSWPGAAWVIEDRGRRVSAGAVGWRCVEPERLPALPETIYDLASLTKPLATAALLALLAEEGGLDLDAPAAALVPGLARDDHGRPTLMDLALHRSGLPAWRPFYVLAKTRDQVLNSIMHLQPEAPCGRRVIYSDPGYILLGEAIMRASGCDLDELFRDRIASPLGLKTLTFRPPAMWKNEIAPTEAGSRYERELALAMQKQKKQEETAPASREEDTSSDPRRWAVPPRDRLIHGEVHDGNAHALGGVAGHAGLFGSAPDVARLAREFLGIGLGLFSGSSLDLFRRNRTPGLEQGRTLGWKTAVGAYEAEGVLSEEAFGHNGFTGTSVWLDPTSVRSYVLLTNRIHPEVRPLSMNTLRRGFHDLARGVA